jgi:exodeoxyribonuclease III
MLFILKLTNSFGRQLPRMAMKMSSTCKKGNGVDVVRVASWNVNGIRSVFKHDPQGQALRNIVEKHKPDVLCLQETKLQESQVEAVEEQFRSVHDDLRPDKIFWSCSRGRKGYSGTAMIIFDVNNNSLFANPDDYSIHYGIGDPDGDIEGRSITLEHKLFSLVNVYVPNSGAGLKRLNYRTTTWDIALASHIERLKKRRGVRTILTGDLNVAHTQQDYWNPHNPATKKQAGTTPEEQTSLWKNFLSPDTGPLLSDTYRQLYPDGNGFSYYSARKGDGGRIRREGMRIDYVLTDDHELSPDMAGSLGLDAFVYEQINHPYSDHCPVGASVRI